MKARQKLRNRVDLLQQRGYAAHEIAEHLRDEGHVVSVDTVRTLLEVRGVSVRRPQNRDELVRWQGQLWTLGELGRVHGIDVRVLRRRLRRGWTLLMSIRRPPLRQAVENALGCAVFFPGLVMLIAVGHWAP